MARFLFCVYGAPGHIHPTLPVAAALRARGHEVAVLTAPAYAPSVESRGLIHLRPRAWNATLDLRAIGPRPRHPLASMDRLRRVLAEKLFPDALDQLRDLRAALVDWPADVLVSSASTYGVSLLAEKERRTWGTHAPFLTCPLPSRDLAPWGVGAAPPATRGQRAKAALLRQVYAAIDRVLARSWRQIRAREGLPNTARKQLTEHLMSPYLYTIPSAIEFDFPRSDLPEHVHYVGPCLPDTPASAPWQSPFPGRDPIVYCTAGTVADPRPLVRAAIEAVRGERIHLFVTLGSHIEPAELGEVPPNVAATTFFPQEHLLPHVDAVLCNGGSGAVMGALRAGKPLVIVPQQSDQPENAARCRALGAAVTIRRPHPDPAELRTALHRVLREESFRAAAARMSGILARQNGPETAAGLFEKLSEVRGPVHREHTRGVGAKLR